MSAYSTADLPPRMAAKIAVNGETCCWEWQAAKNPAGYGACRVAGVSTILAHRAAYLLLVGPIADGLDLDHLCRVRHCVNPVHLEPVTRGENVRRGDSAKLQKETCLNGHPLSADNLYLSVGANGRPKRACRECVLTRGRARVSDSAQRRGPRRQRFYADPELIAALPPLVTPTRAQAVRETSPGTVARQADPRRCPVSAS